MTRRATATHVQPPVHVCVQDRRLRRHPGQHGVAHAVVRRLLVHQLLRLGQHQLLHLRRAPHPAPSGTPARRLRARTRTPSPHQCQPVVSHVERHAPFRVRGRDGLAHVLEQAGGQLRSAPRVGTRPPRALARGRTWNLRAASFVSSASSRAVLAAACDSSAAQLKRTAARSYATLGLSARPPARQHSNAGARARQLSRTDGVERVERVLPGEGDAELRREVSGGGGIRARRARTSVLEMGKRSSTKNSCAW